MTFKANIDEASRIIYYAAAVGNDDFDGRSLEVPKSTPQAAITAAAALLPPPQQAEPVRVQEAQGGVFVGDIVLEDFVLFEGTLTALVPTGSIGITAADNMSFECQGVVGTVASSVLLMIDGNVSFGGFIDALQGRGASSQLCKVTGSVDDIFIEARQILADAENICCFYVDATSPTAIDINCDTAILNADNGIFFESDQPNFSDVVTLDVTTIASPGLNPTAIHLLPTNKGNVTAYCQVMAGAILCEGGGLAIDVLSINGDITIKSGVFATIKSVGVLQGDILVEAGGTLFIEVENHLSGTVTNNGTMHGVVAGVDYGQDIYVPAEELLLVGSSMSDQNPTTTDDPLQIEFGAAQGSGSDPVEIDANGTVTINEDRQYMFRATFQFGRTAAGGVSWLFLRATINGTQFGNSILVKLDNANIDTPAQLTGTADLVDGDILKFEIVRDSQGNNSGGLITETPTLSWNDSPSATLRINRGILVKP